MHTPVYDLAYLYDPRTVAVGRLDAHSDHDIYRTLQEADAEQTSLKLSLNGSWQFHYVEHPSQRPVGFEQPHYDRSGWDTIQVPGHIQLQGYGFPQYVNTQYPWDGHEAIRPPQVPQKFNSVGSYARWVDIPEGWRNDRVVLTFHGVETAFYLWVNGQFIGYSEDSFTPSHFDITPALKDGPNLIAVEVFRFSTASWLEDQDFWRFSGIFRDVELSCQPRAHVRDLFVHPELDDTFTQGTLRVEADLLLPEEAVTLIAQLCGPDGEPVEICSLPAAKETVFSRAVAAPALWSAEAPNLYTLRLILTNEAGQELEVAETRLGFRRFEIKNSVMWLNGKRILFRGVNRHEFCAEAGRAITPEHMLQDILTLKRHNLNAVRTSHYPNHPLWYKLCDEYGIYLIDETNMETHGTWMMQHKVSGTYAVPNDNPDWLPAVIDRCTSMQERDKNHPSVLIFSCGNESYGGRNIFEMAEHMRRRDPSRPIHYEGIFHDRRYNATSDMESQMYTTAAGVAAFIEAHPEKPFVLCEYSHAMGNSCGGLHKYLELERKYPQYQGGFIWDFIDQALAVTAPNGNPRLAWGGDFGERPTDREFCGNGLVFADRTLTPRLQEVKYLYQGARILPDATGVTLINDLLFTDLDAYQLRWQLCRDGEPVQQGVVNHPACAPGETVHIDLPVSLPDAPGEYLLHCGLYLKAPTLWANTDWELMHGEAVVKTVPHAPVAAVKDYDFVPGDVNLGIQGKEYSLLFGFKEGGLSSLKNAQRMEMLCTPPRLSLFRAFTSNDKGNRDYITEALWHAASLYSPGKFLGHEQAGDAEIFRYQHALPLTDGAVIDLTYTALGQGRVQVEMAFEGKAGLPDLPSFGLALRLPRELCHWRYYGLGPEENTSDRKHGALLGWHETTAEENMVPYLKPQDCGTREGVRQMTLTNGEGQGLKVEMVDAPLSVSVLPWSPEELTAARHLDELAEPTYTYLDIALKRKGVGGDNSWGAPVHPEYHIPADQPLKLRFILTIL